MPRAASPFSIAGDGIRVRVRLTPNAQKDRVVGIVADEQEKGVLRIAVNAVPEQGRANKALIKFVSKQWRVPKSHITLVSGAKDRLKTLNIEGEQTRLMQALTVWAGQFE